MLNRAKTICVRLINFLISPKVTYLVAEPLFGFMKKRKYKELPELSNLKHILVIRLDEIGDTILTTSFLRELRHNLPHAYISLVVNSNVFNLMELCPYVNQVLCFDWKVNGPFPQLERHVRAMKFAWKYLWKRHFDLAIIPRFDVDYYHATFISYFSGASLRIGYSESVTKRKKTLNRGFDILLTHVLNTNSVKHEVEHNLNMITFLGGQIQGNHLEIWLDQADHEYAENLLKGLNIDSEKPLIAFGPGANAANRKWPLSNFIELAAWLRETYQAHIVVIGGPGEESIGYELKSQLPDAIIDAVGETTLRQACALLKYCQLYVGNDSGPMHMASAVGIPIIEVSTHPQNASPRDPNSPFRFHPWGVPYILFQPQTSVYPCIDVCRSQDAHCIRSVSVRDVQLAIKTILS